MNYEFNLTEEQINKIVKMRQVGYSFSHIAQAAGCTPHEAKSLFSHIYCSFPKPTKTFAEAMAGRRFEDAKVPASTGNLKLQPSPTISGCGNAAQLCAEAGSKKY